MSEYLDSGVLDSRMRTGQSKSDESLSFPSDHGVISFISQPRRELETFTFSTGWQLLKHLPLRSLCSPPPHLDLCSLRQITCSVHAVHVDPGKPCAFKVLSLSHCKCRVVVITASPAACNYIRMLLHVRMPYSSVGCSM